LLDIARLYDDNGTEWVQIILIALVAIFLLWPQPCPSYVRVFIQKISVGSFSLYSFLIRKVFNMLLKFINWYKANASSQRVLFGK